MGAAFTAGATLSLFPLQSRQRREGQATERDVVDAMFDAFRREGAGELIGWIALTRQREALRELARQRTSRISA